LHLDVDDLDDAARGFIDAQPERVGDRIFNRPFGRAAVEP
jgi:hypothetical protein